MYFKSGTPGIICLFAVDATECSMELMVNGIANDVSTLCLSDSRIRARHKALNTFSIT